MTKIRPKMKKPVYIIYILFLTFFLTFATKIYALLNEPTFNNYNEAISWVRENYVGETADTSRSSWIKGLYYFQADGKGFLIINMKGKEYIFRGVSRQIWEQFKNDECLGCFYHKHIKGEKYYFHLNK